MNVCLLYTLGHVPHYHNETRLVWISFIVIGGVITETGAWGWRGSDVTKLISHTEKGRVNSGRVKENMITQMYKYTKNIIAYTDDIAKLTELLKKKKTMKNILKYNYIVKLFIYFDAWIEFMRR